MPIKELREKYGKGKSGETLRRAIRAEIPGSAKILDALTIASRNQKKSDDWRKIYESLVGARDEMISDVARRYQFKTTTNNEGKENNETVG